MKNIKLYDSELKIMEIIWENEPITAKEISLVAEEKYEWNKNTTYTVIKKMIEKNYVLRSDPNFICTSNIKQKDVQRSETKSLIDRLYNGSRKAFFAAFADEELTEEEINQLKSIIEKR